MRKFIRKTCRRLRHWLKQILVAVDQLANTILGGWADETLSSRLWRNRHRPGWRHVRSALDFVAALLGDFDHCQASYESEARRLQCPPELRQT